MPKVPKDKVKPAVTKGTKTTFTSHIDKYINLLIFNEKKSALCVSVGRFPLPRCNYLASIVKNTHLSITFPPRWPIIVEGKGQTSPREERYISGAPAGALIHITIVGLCDYSDLVNKM